MKTDKLTAAYLTAKGTLNKKSSGGNILAVIRKTANMLARYNSTNP